MATVAVTGGEPRPAYSEGSDFGRRDRNYSWVGAAATSSVRSF